MSDDLFANDLRNKIDQAVQDVIIASRIVDGFKDPQQNAHLKNHAHFPLESVTLLPRHNYPFRGRFRPPGTIH